MTWTIITIIAVLLILRYSRNFKKPYDESISHERIPQIKEDISEEYIIKAQTRFEKDLGNTYLPDAIKYSDLYIYRHLMRIWFAELSAKYRYDDSMINKLRKDWLSYMDNLEEGRTTHYLSMELYGENEEKSDDYSKRSEIAQRKTRSIEDGFASAVGKKAMEELSSIRNLEFGRISKDGDLAPDGMEFDIEGKLQKKK